MSPSPLLLALALALCPCPPALSEDVPKARLERLTRGLNLSHWFAQGALSTEHLDTYNTALDLRRIRDMGFRHVRLTLDPRHLFRPQTPAALDPEKRVHLDRALDQILDLGLAVVVDLHPEDEFKERLYISADFRLSVQAFWQALAAHLARRDPEYLFLEVLNEPATEDPQTWYALQRPLLAAMRRGAPHHTLVASANQRAGAEEWGSHRALVLIEPLDDANIVYNFHYYDPLLFTHQGANWGWDMLRNFRDLPYPSTPERVAPLLAGQHGYARLLLEWYGQDRWNEEKIRDELWPVTAWARQHRVPITCNEFGVYRRYAPRADRLIWLENVRQALEELDIGWAMWDYAGGFGAVVDAPGERRAPDEDVLRALGLR